jgi:uncharacterized protein with PQ loop repeat
MLATLSQVVVGMTSQVRKLAIQKTTAGLAFTAVLTTGLGFTAWTIYSVVAPINFYVLIPNGLGAIYSVVILAQMIKINRRGADNLGSPVEP